MKNNKRRTIRLKTGQILYLGRAGIRLARLGSRRCELVITAPKDVRVRRTELNG